MKKIIILIIVVLIISSTMKGDSIIIPDEAIRFRVIANSNSIEDQNIKNTLKETLEKDIYKYLSETNSIEEAKKVLENNLGNINNNVEAFLINNNIPYTHQISLGSNNFPSKEYKGVIYQEGEYESLVITLGKGIGDNWWCVLFPPLCLLEAEENNTEEVVYKSFVKELIDKYMK